MVTSLKKCLLQVRVFYSRQAWVNGTQENEVKEWVDLTRFDVNENKTMVRDSGATKRLVIHETLILHTIG